MITRRQTLAGAAATSLLPTLLSQTARSKEAVMTDTIIVNARITTLDRENPQAEAVAIRDGKFLTVGSEQEVRAAAPEATVIDARGTA